MYYVGIDWADKKHDLTIVDQTGTVILKNFRIKSDRNGFENLMEKLREISEKPTLFKIGIETPHNLLVDFLVDLCYPVFSIFPGSMKSFRKRYRSSGARDDAFDSFVLADVLRTDKACWSKVDFGSDLVREIRILVRDHHSLIEQQTALINGMRSTLKAYYPEYIQFFANVACQCSLRFILNYPDFQSASKLNPQQLKDFFKEHNLRNGKKVSNIYNLLQQKNLDVPQVVVNTKKMKAISCAKNLVQLSSDINTYINRTNELVHQHPDSEIFLSYPGVAIVTAARLIALFGDNRNLYTNVSQMQALAGTCPVTEKTGDDFRIIYYRRACNKFYRDCMHNLAFSSLNKAEWAMSYYKKHRAMGKKHSHALRCLANLHLKILFAMWKNYTQYDENMFLAQKVRHSIKSKIFYF